MGRLVVVKQLELQKLALVLELSIWLEPWME